MKKKSILFLSVICILSFCVFTGLLIYAFQLQIQKDSTQQKETDLKPTVLPSEDNVKNTGDNNENDYGSPKPVNEPPATAEETGKDATEEQNNDSKITICPTPADQEVSDTTPSEPIVLGFAGDINFNEGSYPMGIYDRENKGILGGLSEDLVAEMKAADVMMLNNEFPYSTRGTKTPDKSYTFRANPKRVDILKEMGVDIVSLANNHALDYGRDALADTFDTLDGAGIHYVGAGENMDRAKAPIYLTIGNTKIAYVAASRVVFAMDWYATDSRSGMIGTYDPTLIIDSIKEAAANSDYVVVFLHWGVERKSHPEDYQRNLAIKYIDAGADIVVGCHPHVLQGFEYYKGKPIAYSLGNYWFNNSTQDTGLLKIYIDPEGTLRTQIVPAIANNSYTSAITEPADRKAYYDRMEKISYGVNIDDDGFITEIP